MRQTGPAPVWAMVTCSAVALALAAGCAPAPSPGVGLGTGVGAVQLDDPVPLGTLAMTLTPQTPGLARATIRASSAGLTATKLVGLWDDRASIGALSASGGHVALAVVNLKNSTDFEFRNLKLRVRAADAWALVSGARQPVTILDPDNSTESGAELGYLAATDAAPYGDYASAQLAELHDSLQGAVISPADPVGAPDALSTDYTSVGASETVWSLGDLRPGACAPTFRLGGSPRVSHDVGVAILAQFPAGATEVHLDGMLYADVWPGSATNVIADADFETNAYQLAWQTENAKLTRVHEGGTNWYGRLTVQADAPAWAKAYLPNDGTMVGSGAQVFAGQRYLLCFRARTTAGKARVYFNQYENLTNGYGWSWLWNSGDLPSAGWGQYRVAVTPGKAVLSYFLTLAAPLASTATTAEIDDLSLVALPDELFDAYMAGRVDLRLGPG